MVAIWNLHLGECRRAAVEERSLNLPLLQQPSCRPDQSSPMRIYLVLQTAGTAAGFVTGFLWFVNQGLQKVRPFISKGSGNLSHVAQVCVVPSSFPVLQDMEGLRRGPH